MKKKKKIRIKIEQKSEVSSQVLVKQEVEQATL